MNYINLLHYHYVIDILLDKEIQLTIHRYILRGYTRSTYLTHVSTSNNLTPDLYICWMCPEYVLLFHTRLDFNVFLFFRVINSKLSLIGFGDLFDEEYRDFVGVYSGLDVGVYNAYLHTLNVKSGCKTYDVIPNTYRGWLNYWNGVLCCAYERDIRHYLSKNRLYSNVINVIIRYIGIEYESIIYY